MTDLEQLKQENQALKDEIVRVKKEIENPEDFDINNIKVEDFNIDENDTPAIQNIKKKIIKSLDMYKNLSVNYKYISGLYKSLCEEININQDDFTNVEAEFQQIKIDIEDAEKKLFSKMEENKFEISKRKKGKIKSLLKENYDLRISKLRISEELRFKKSQLSMLKILPINEKQNSLKSKDDVEKLNYEELESFIRTKANTSLSSHQKFLDLRMAIESINFIKTIPEEFFDDKNSRQLKENINEINQNKKSFEVARKSNQVDQFSAFLDTLANKKKDLNQKLSDFYKLNIKSFQQELKYAEIKYQVESANKIDTIKSLNELSKSLKKFKEEIEKTQKKINEINSHIESEKTLFETCKDVSKINQAIGAKNDEYKLTLGEIKNMKFSHQAEINKICFILNIPLMTLNESPNSAHTRILKTVRELKKYDNKNQSKVHALETSLSYLKQQNETLKKLINDDED